MNTRLLTLSLMFGALLLALGCNGAEVPVAAEAAPDDQPKGGTLTLAPMPRAQGEKAPVPTPWVAPKSTKPWSELIVGKWLHVRPGAIGQFTYEFTRDGKCISRLSYPARPNHPKGLEVGTRNYRVNGDVLFPTAFLDDEINVTETTRFIESLTENELVTCSVNKRRVSRFAAQAEAAGLKTAGRKVSVEELMAQVREETQGRGFYVRLKDK